MQKRTIAGTEVSLLGFGAMRFPTKDNEIDMRKSAEMIDYCMASGVNYYDTAYPYHDGKSEEALSALLSGYDRKSYLLADKFPPWLLNDPTDIPQIFATQLKRLNTDYIDFYLLHSMERGNLDVLAKMKVYEHFYYLKQEGIIKHLGFSFHDEPHVLSKIISDYDFDFAQIQMNYLDWSYMQSEQMYNILENAGIPIIVMEPVRGGFLADPSPSVVKRIKAHNITPAALALKWCAQYEGVKCILSGMSDIGQVLENVALFTNYKPITETENALALEAAALINDIKTIPCTACGYCMKCPFGVDIPALFKIYNHYMAVKDSFRTGLTYKNYFDSKKKPENCTACGVCIPRCPQHIDIPKSLVTAGDTLNAL